ncbi:hypothetical protein M378DRAFT_172292 [Amanita muscaria Koide BX008]|uniref:Glycosyltransferase family 25 protein n=1 Tax=Amanita muscaria (strain Koide BX008) TaxID=946122 RepID=A0A0C2W704_AMAMK|nr:hypothetical protein M378DRAFT_172292 [Amanita muscaria Koide BX008]
MATLPTRRFVVPAIVLVLLYSLLSKLLIGSMTPVSWQLVTYTPNQLDQLALSDDSGGSTPSSTTLGVFSKIYVVSLLHRTERREQMDRLRTALGLEWTYFPAVSSDNEVVHAVMQSVRKIREECLENDCAQAFTWPDEIDYLAASPLDLWNSDFLNSTDIPNLSKAWLENPPSSSLICATRNFTFTKNTTQVKPHWLLTPARTACWHSHLSVIHLVANEERLDPKSSVLVLEDDVDMESDIQSQLSALWPLLPREWDIVFLG